MSLDVSKGPEHFRRDGAMCDEVQRNCAYTVTRLACASNPSRVSSDHVREDFRTAEEDEALRTGRWVPCGASEAAWPTT